MVAELQPSPLEAGIAAYFDLDEIRPAASWLEEVMYIPYGETTGFVRFEKTPWAREPINGLTDPEVQFEACIYGSQLAKTTQAIGVALATVCLAKQSAVWMWPTEKVARSFSQTKFQKVVEHSPVLRALKHPNHDLFKNLEMHFVHGVLSLVGSHASVDQKQRSVPVVIIDEIEDIAAGTDKETDPITSIEERTKTFTDKKIFLFGSCLLETGPAWKQYLRGDQRHFLVPCPHCGTFQALEFRGAIWLLNRTTGELEQRGSGDDLRLWWDQNAARIDDHNVDFDIVRATACYLCADCGGQITDHHKPAMLAAGRWVPTCRAKVYGQRSRRISALYPTWPNTSFANVAIKFLGSRASTKELQNFTNNWEAKPWTTGLDLSDKKAVHRRLEYLLGTHTHGERVGARTLLVADVQRHHLVWGWIGFDGSGNVHLIDCGYVPDFAALRKLDDELKPDWVAVDARHRPQEVYEAVHERRARWMAIRGEADKPKSAPLSPNYVFDPFTGDNAGRQGLSVIALIHLNSDLWGEELLNRLYPARANAAVLPGALPVPTAQAGTPLNATLEEKNRAAAAAEYAANAPRIADLFVFQDMARIAADFVPQIFSEYLIDYIDAKGREARKWHRSKNNHLFDILKYAYAIGSLLNLTRIGAETRKQLEAAAAEAAKNKTPELALTTPSGGTPLFR